MARFGGSATRGGSGSAGPRKARYELVKESRSSVESIRGKSMRTMIAITTILLSAVSSASASEAFISQMTGQGATAVDPAMAANAAAEMASKLASPLQLSALKSLAQSVQAQGPTIGNMSYVAQTGTNNFAAVAQASGNNFSALIQHGSGNQAIVMQRQGGH